VSDTVQRPRLVVGTAGHIDHGKSRLVYKLTGTDPDRLPEEQVRGMTIDLGFAHARIDDADIWFVDVPGHERFLRNMVAGATGIDLPLLVVAADDSAMPQTREHVGVLSLLGFSHCLLALSKMDLVDDAWADAVEQDVRALLNEQGLTPLEVLRTSAETGRGLDELRAALARLARERPPDPVSGVRWFRMPIDRAFMAPGRGTVVTGSVWHGALRSGDELELWPAGARVRARDLQTHNEQTEQAADRMRLAINLAGVAVKDAGRGCEVATPGYLEASTCLDVYVRSLRMPGLRVRRSLRLRLHIATAESLARLDLVQRPETSAVHNVFGQLHLSHPIVATWGQRFILRDEAATRTLGGGQVLLPVARRWSRKSPPDTEALATLLSGPPKRRLEIAVKLAVWEAPAPGKLAARCGVEDAAAAERFCRQLASEKRLVRFGIGGTQHFVHRDVLDAAATSIQDRIAAFLRENPRAAGVPRREIVGWVPASCPERLRSALAEWLVGEGKLVEAGGFVVPAGHAAALSAEDRALLETILDEFASGAFRPPGLSELRCRTERNARRVEELVDLAAAQGRLVRIAEGLWLHADRWRELAMTLVAALRERREITVADVRALLDSTRKYVVPILEHADAQGLTRRRGDVRVLGPRAGEAEGRP
jgi:selenocysteine-specific elongation factor